MTPTQDTLRIATYNIHKGVQGFGHAVEQLDAYIICLQEVRKVHRRQELQFTRWPDLPQADFLAPEGYEAVYRTNAFTRHGEHGNALLSRWPGVTHRHEDISDHRFEQRGLLHAEVMVQETVVHVIVVHFGLVPAGRLRQAQRLGQYIQREVPDGAPVVVAGDFNDWGVQVQKALNALDLRSADTMRCPTYPSRLPIVQLDYVYARGLHPIHAQVPRGKIWGQMSDHLPLIAEFRL